MKYLRVNNSMLSNNDSTQDFLRNTEVTFGSRSDDHQRTTRQLRLTTENSNIKDEFSSSGLNGFNDEEKTDNCNSILKNQTTRGESSVDSFVVYPSSSSGSDHKRLQNANRRACTAKIPGIYSNSIH